MYGGPVFSLVVAVHVCELTAHYLLLEPDEVEEEAYHQIIEEINYDDLVNDICGHQKTKAMSKKTSQPTTPENR